MSAGNKAASVVFSGVTKAFGTVLAVRDVSFRIEAGTLVTLLGPSGCGKTTTLRLIAGLEMATQGQILIGDDDVSSLPATDRDVSMVFQSYALFPHMTVLQNVSYGLVVSRVPKRAAYEKAEQYLAQVGLEGYGKRLPSELSGGQQQRVAVARALVLEPEVLLFDEPLSNLDAKLRRQVREDIRELQQTLKLTSVYVTHDQEEALAVSDKIIVMREAEIAQEGRPHELYEQPVDSFVADFVGDANLVSAAIASIEKNEAIVRVGGLTLRLPHREMQPGDVRLAIRPEAIHLTPRDQASAGIAGQVRKVTYLGSHYEYTVRTELGDLFVIDPVMKEVRTAGSDVSVQLGQRGVTLVKDAGAKGANGP